MLSTEAPRGSMPIFASKLVANVFPNHYSCGKVKTVDAAALERERERQTQKKRKVSTETKTGNARKVRLFALCTTVGHAGTRASHGT